MSEIADGKTSAYEALRAELRETALFGSMAGVLSWDQEVMMPRAGTSLRAQQIALLSQIVHERRTSDAFEALLAASEEEAARDDDPVVTANLREIRRSFDQAVRIPTALIRELAETTTHAQHAWRSARENSDFAAFEPWLKKVMELNRAQAECLATPETPELYDALLDQYEPGARAEQVERAFSELREQLAPLIREIADAPQRPSDRIQRIRIPVPSQQDFNARVAERIGFDFTAGRLDTSTHPFCQGAGPGDTRLTTRYREDAFFDALSSTLHESGHGLYEQGLPKEAHFGEPIGEPVSLGIHESQSRMWENFVGRSRAFWQWALPEAKQAFGAPFDEVGLDEVYGAMNLVAPGLIRVDSDEATYNLHIMLRFDLERAMLSGDLAVADLPTAWNDRMRADLGIEVPDDRNGCLQDVHWSMGAIGYFPTYTLGNLYAAQFWVRLRRDLTSLDEELARGEFEGLLAWLRREIHQHGRRYTAPELCEKVTGEALTATPFLEYLEGKLRPLYGI